MSQALNHLAYHDFWSLAKDKLWFIASKTFAVKYFSNPRLSLVSPLSSLFRLFPVHQAAKQS